ncbi:MAG: hypothetical protein M1816_002373 [Peltula sp. TS41687]|nr:MAG: hypothetical protein M1816_002373 [Peltula sp. TS41687]
MACCGEKSGPGGHTEKPEPIAIVSPPGYQAVPPHSTTISDQTGGENYTTLKRPAFSTSRAGLPSIFEVTDKSNSFAVRYFERSPQHQDLRRVIEAEAEWERSQKQSELATKRRQYQELTQRSGIMVCDYVQRRRGNRQVSEHRSSCQKFELQSKVTNLRVRVHKWPLSERDEEAKAAVFELSVPSVISNVLVDICSVKEPSLRGQNKIHPLHGYAGLRQFVQSQAGRIQLASTTKPFAIAYYNNLRVSQADESNVCVKNGLRYAMYDMTVQKRTEELLHRCTVCDMCTAKLLSGPYKSLQVAVENTVHTSNEVIANQGECPKELNIHEFYAFATLRSDHRLQWRNIARELATRLLNFSCEETHTLIIQAAWQVGPLSGTVRCSESHVDLEEKEFEISLLSVLEKALGTVQENWQGAVAARTFVALATRLLFLSSENIVLDRKHGTKRD